MRAYHYEKLDENYNMKYCPMNDPDGSVTGHIVMNVPAWFDENPEERIRLGWIKHIDHYSKEVEYDKQTQYLTKSVKEIDEYTIEDVFNVLEKSEEMLLLEEMLEALTYEDRIIFADGGVL